MMTLRVIGTGSSGNCYLLTDKNDNTLILDAGIKASVIRAEIRDSETVCGCLVTHEHNDHSRAAFELALHGIRVGMSNGTMDCIKARNTVNVERLIAKQTYVYGVYKVMPFDVQHDAAEPYGFLIEHMPTREKVVYATDTYYLRYTFPNVQYWIVECNYVDDCISETNEFLRRRLLTSHMSLRRLEDVFRANNLSQTSRIIIVHLSDSRSDEQMMVRRLHELTEVEVIPARAGEKIRLEREPF